MNYFSHISQCKRTIFLLSAVLFTAVSLGLAARADEFPSAISVKAILPENQADNVSYYDLRLNPGDGQTVQMRLTNAEDRPVVATVELNPATTSMGGTIVYSHADTLDESVKYPIGEIAKVRAPVVEIPAKDSVLVDIDIEMPRETIDGVVLGGLRVTADYPEASSGIIETAQGSGLQIKNKFAYVIGLKLSQGGVEPAPDFILKSVGPDIVNYAAAVVLNIQNSEPAIAKNIQFSAQVFRKGSSDVLKELVKDNAEMAPNSNCDYVIDWGNGRIEPGEYRVSARMTHNGRVWEWDEDFTVAAREAGSINGAALGIVEDTDASPALKYVLAFMLLALIVLLAYVLNRRGRRQEKA